MLRTAHMKACVNQLGFLRSPATLGRSSGVLRGDDASEHATHVCIRTRLPLTHTTVSGVTWTHTPHTLSLFLHGSELPARSRGQEWERSPGSGVKRQTCCFCWLAGVGSGRCKSASRSSVQTRGLHRRSVTDECLSAGNEARCRRSLQANGALYGQRGGSWAAVLVCLCAVSGDPALLFTLRSAQLKGRHKGDVSFAGGKKDPSDGSVVDTALREAREELGIHVTEEKVWGVMKPLQDMSGMMIAPVIANLGPLETLSFRPNPSEVEEIFTLTLEHLCQAQNRGYTHFRTGDRYGYTVPVFHSPKYRIWGLTAVALDHALKLIVPPKTLSDRSTFNTEAAC